MSERAIKEDEHCVLLPFFFPWITKAVNWTKRIKGSGEGIEVVLAGKNTLWRWGRRAFIA